FHTSILCRSRRAGTVPPCRSFRAYHVIDVAIVVVTEVLDDVLVGYPLLRPRRGPRARVRPRVVDRDLVSERVDVRARDALDQMQRLGVRIAFTVQPEPLVEADRVDHERVAFPVSDRVTEVARIQQLARRMLSPVHVDLAPRARRAAGQDVDALDRRHLDDLEPERHRELTGPA